ncbi:LysR family transcriptional regulator [Planktotalea sp.]|uniref:LysR family transcriptional regulator n=1 Tax=Planktotalea sp. TaxID=2029877 RepID=UPI003F6AAB47
MSKPPSTTELSLKGLELFQICARNGSLQACAQETRLSVSTVSHHLRKLEDHVGVALFDHARKPMVLTQKGHVFLRSIEEALQIIREAKAQASAGNVTDARSLRLGAIEDFESDIMPELAVHLSQKMPNCDFAYHTASSREIIGMLRNREIDLGLASSPSEQIKDLNEHALLRDPFVLVVPAGIEVSSEMVLKGHSDLPFLQFSSHLMIANQIEAQLKRLGLASPKTFECASNQTLMAMVYSGAGWAITTPLLVSRAQRFQAGLTMHPFPDKQFARTLSLITTPDCAGSVFNLVNDKIRAAISTKLIAPVHQSAPWLEKSFSLLG